VQIMKKTKIFLLTVLSVTLLLGIALLQAKDDRSYSYLPKPPITINALVTPDQVTYEAGGVIDIAILIKLDSLYCDPDCEYRVYVGDLNELLKNSEIITPAPDYYYILNRQKLADVISFKVKMLNRGNPPYFALKAMRVAPDNSTAKKHFLDIIIDEYSITYITTPEYFKARNSGYILPSY
jgi:hypothetical protein